MFFPLMVQHVMEPAELEAVGDAEQQEAWFRHLSVEQEGQTQADKYRRQYLQWLKQPMEASTAYVQRACMNLQAKCYLQVRTCTLLHQGCLSVSIVHTLWQGRMLNHRSACWCRNFRWVPVHSKADKPAGTKDNMLHA